MASKYLLSTGRSTSKIEEYVMDLLDLYIKINPGDIPHNDSIGFNFILTNTMKDELENEIVYRLKSLIDTIKSQVPDVGLKIESITLINEEKVRLVLQINGKVAEEYYISLRS